jgi:hypothetical protein
MRMDRVSLADSGKKQRFVEQASVDEAGIMVAFMEVGICDRDHVFMVNTGVGGIRGA